MTIDENPPENPTLSEEARTLSDFDVSKISSDSVTKNFATFMKEGRDLKILFNNIYMSPSILAAYDIRSAILHALTPAQVLRVHNQLLTKWSKGRAPEERWAGSHCVCGAGPAGF